MKSISCLEKEIKENYYWYHADSYYCIDDFFYDNPDIADKYGFITVLDDKPLGHIS